jgi:hypothetical protein
MALVERVDEPPPVSNHRVHVSAHNGQEKASSDPRAGEALRRSAAVARDSASAVDRTAVVARMFATVVRKCRYVAGARSCNGPCRCSAHPGKFERPLEATAASFRRCCAPPRGVQTGFALARTPRLAPPRWLSSRAAAIRRAPDAPGLAHSSTARCFTDPSDRPCRSARCDRSPRPACGTQHVWNRSVARERDLHAAIAEPSNVRRRLAVCARRSNRAIAESAGSAPLTTLCEKHPLPCNSGPKVVLGRRRGSYRQSSQRNDGSKSQTSRSWPVRRHLAPGTSDPCTGITR